MYSSYQQGPPQYQPQMSYPQQQDDRYNQQSVKRSQQSQQQQGQQLGTENKDPLATKAMVLYVIPGDPASTRVYQMATDYPEIFIQDARQIIPRPPWLKGVPTVVRVSDKAVFDGPAAYQAVMAYVQNLKAMSGPQATMVVPTVDPNSGFQVAAKEHHYLACADETRTAAVPVGTSTRTAMTVGQVDFAQHDDPRYYSNEKGVSETALNAYIAAREQKRQPQVNWRPSVLENGEMINL